MLTEHQVQGQVPNYVLFENFDTLDSAVWDVYEFGSPNFNYTVDSWLGEDSWVYVANMSTGGSDPAYNGYHIVHTFVEPLDGAFIVEAGIGWSAPSMTPASQTALRLLDATDDLLEDNEWTIQVQCRDYWVASPCRQVFHIEREQYEGSFLPLSGSTVIRIQRNTANLVRIYWNNTLFFTGINHDTITRICLRIVGRHDFPGASGGFNYIYAKLPPIPSYPPTDPLPPPPLPPPPPTDPQSIIPEWYSPVIGIAIIIIVLQLIIIIHLVRRRHSIGMAK